MRWLTLFMSVLLFCEVALADDSTISIRLDNADHVATDLVQDGKALSESEVLRLKSQDFDISLLNPDPSATDYWKPPGQALPSALPEQDELLDPTGGAKLLNWVDSEAGTARLLVQSASTSERALIQISREDHRMLLRKALLEKLGYRIPPIQWIPKISLTLDPATLGSFKQTLAIWVGEPTDWITAQSEGSFELQDVVAFEDDRDHYDLATGYAVGATENTRLFNALALAYSLVEYPADGPQSMPWSFGELSQEKLTLEFQQNISGFHPTMDDARWIARLIGALKRSDFQEIARASEFPPEVQAYLVEKLISRRNSLIQELDLQIPALPYDSSVTIQSAKISGYADPFKSSPPPAPLSMREVVPYAESSAESAAIDTAVSEFNQRVLMGLSQQVLTSKLRSILTDAGKKAVPLGIWIAPAVGPSLVVSREITMQGSSSTGSPVQVADTVGESFEIGVTAGASVPSAPVVASVSASRFRSKIYSHVHPLTDMNAVFQVPFRNLYADLKSGASSDPATLRTELDKDLPAGDSLVITETRGDSVAAAVGPGLNSLFSLQFLGQHTSEVLHRTVIYRLNDDTIWVYSDAPELRQSQLGVSLHVIAPIAGFSHDDTRGSVGASYYSFNLNTQASEIAELLKTGTLTGTPALRIGDVIRDKDDSLQVLHVTKEKLQSDYQLKVADGNGDSRSLVRVWRSNLRDSDPVNFVVQTGNQVLNQSSVSTSSQSVSSTGSVSDLSPTDLRQFESYLDAVVDDSSGELSRIFYSSRRIRRLWRISKADLQKDVAAMNATAGDSLITPEQLNGIESIQFYSGEYRTVISEDGVQRLITLDPRDIRDALAQKQDVATKISNLIASYLSRSNAHRQNALDPLLQALTLLDQSLTFKELETLLGSDLCAAIPILSGYTTGDNVGYQTIQGTVSGHLSPTEPYGPIENIAQNTGVFDTELLSSWLVKGEAQ